MALKVGELVAFIRADSAQFDQAVDRSGGRFKSLRSTVSDGARAMSQVLVGLTTATAAVGIAAFKVGLDYNRMQQSSRAALTTLLGSAEAANEQMDKLDEFAKTSPFAKDVFIRAQQQLIGFGREAEDVVPILDAVQQAVAATGGSNQQISELVSIIAKVGATGKLTAEDLNQFGERGVDAATIIGESMGKTGAQIREDITGGALDAEVAIDALTAGMQERFGGATANIKEQFDGAADRIKAAFRDIGSVLAAPFIDPNGGGYLVTWTNRVADGMRNVETKLKPLVDLLVQRFRPGLESVDDLLERAGDAINAWDISKVNGQLDRLSRYAPLIASTSAAIFAFGTQNLPILSTLGISGINPVVAGLAALVATSPELRDVGRDFLEALSPLVPVAEQLTTATADAALAVLDELSPALRDLLEAAAPAIVAIGESLAPVLVGLLEAAEPAAEVIGTVAGVIAEVPTPVLIAVAAFAALHGPLKTLNVPLQRATESMVRFGQQAKVQAALGNTNIAVGALSTASMTARGAVSRLGTAMKVAFISNPVGLALTAITTALGAFAVASANAKARADGLRETLDDLGNVTEDTADLIRERLVTGADADWGWFQSMRTGSDSAADAIESLGITLDDAVGAVMGTDEEFEAFVKTIVDANDGVIMYGSAADEVITKLSQQRTATADARHEQEQLAPAIEETADATEGAADAIEAQNDALRTNVDLLRDAAGNALSLREAQLRSEDQQDRFTDALARYNEVNKDSEATDRDKEAAYRDLETALLNQVTGYTSVTDAMIKNNTDAETLRQTVQAQRDAFIENAIEIGNTAEEAEKLADQYGLIPEVVVTDLELSTQAAERNIQAFLQEWDSKTITTYQRLVTTGAGAAHGNPNIGTSADGSAWDGTVRSFAGGGINAAGHRVARVPQIVAGGANILWGEPETGWEAYISGKPGMRNRNLQILDEAARRLGSIPVPAGAARFADGGMAGAAGGGGDTTINMTIDASTLRSVSDFAALVDNARRYTRQMQGA